MEFLKVQNISTLYNNIRKNQLDCGTFYPEVKHKQKTENCSVLEVSVTRYFPLWLTYSTRVSPGLLFVLNITASND